MGCAFGFSPRPTLGSRRAVGHLARPTSRPDWLSAEEFAALPAELVLRQRRVQVPIPGFRVRSLVVVTTLSNCREFSREDIADLFRQRWQAELDLLDQNGDANGRPAPQDADMIRKEMWTHLLAYNLLRSLMLPRRRSRT